MSVPAEDRPLKRTIPPDLQRGVEDIQIKIPRTTGPSDDLDDRRKRWLIVGICLHTIISRVLRTYVVNVVTKLCYSLTCRNKIHKQTYGSHLERYAPTKTQLNYQAINNNKTKRNKAQYDYRVKTPVDLSRLFLQTYMAHFTAFDDSCDSSALLGIIVNIDRFPPGVQADARKIRSDIRNPWAHCDFTEWTAIKYTDYFQLMGQLIRNLKLSNREENKILGELNRWETNGLNFLSGTTLGLEVVGEIRQQTHVLSRYVQTLCTETDSQFIRVQKELSNLVNSLEEHEERLKSLESIAKENKETIKDVIKRVEDHIPQHIRGPPGDLDEEKKRWLIVGICLHSIISPLLRKYVDPILSNLYSSLVSSNSIDTQSCNGYLKKYPVTNIYYLNYESVNNNRRLNKNYRSYDYRVTSHVDLSKLFLQPNMAQYSGINETCDLSALLGLIINIHDISIFPSSVQTDAEKIRSDIRNPWAHCEFREWTTGKYTHSFNAMGQLVKDIGLTNREENRILGELNTWATNGQQFLSGTTLGLEIVGELRQQTHVLSRYVQTLCYKAGGQYIKVQKELSRIENDLQERIKNLESKSMEHDGTLNTLKEKKKKQVEDHIPPHIRAHHRQEIREWEQDQTTFLETRATRHILESLPSHNCIVVTGSSGCGKSSNIHQAALHLRDSLEYEIIPVLTGPTDIMNYYNENKKQVFIVDDICGKETINMQTLQTWRDYSEKMEEIFKVADKDDAIKIHKKISSSKLLISCRLHIYKELQFQRVKLFTKKECNLLSRELCLQDEERLHMLRRYLPDDIITKLNVKQVTENFYYFPLLCKLSKDKTLKEVKTLFKSPLESIKMNIQNIIHENIYQFCALTLTILFGGEFNTDWLTQIDLKSASEATGSKLEQIVKEFDIDLSKERHRNSLKSGFATLSGTYLKQRGSLYRMMNRKIYKIAALICGQLLTKCFIKYAPSVFIQDHFIFRSLLEVNDDSIVIFEDQEEDYFERLVCDLKEYVISSTFKNNMLRYTSFRGKLISYLRRSDETKLCLKKIDTMSGKESSKYTHCSSSSFVSSTFLVDKLCYASPLLEIASHDFTDLVNFLISINFNVNVTDHYGNSPLHKASKGGHINVVKLLLESNADVFQLNNGGESALYVACEGLHTEIVNLFLQYNANASECNKHGESPLFVACKGGHTNIVRLLLQNNADVNQFSKMGESPLFVACKGGHTNIVRLLLQNNADVNQFSKMGESPLFVACKGGHTDIVELLLQHHADFSKCNNSGESPMDVACAGGNTDIVKLLLQNNANVSQVNYVGKFPLYVACESGHTHTVKMLLQNKADVDQSNSDGESSLYVACKRGYTSIVKTLLHNNADFSQSTTSKRSPLFVACEGGHTATAKVLLENNADVSQFTISERSPLFVACEGGHTDTVKLLLENNADVSQCNSCGQSPLFVAREKGHTAIEELLLMNGGDISHVNFSGKFVLNVANVRGHSNSVKMVLQDNTGVSKCYHEKTLAMDTVSELPYTGSLLLTPIVCDGYAIDVMVDKRLIDSHNVRKKTTKDFQKLKDDIEEGKMNEFQILSLVSTFLKETKQRSLSPYRELLIHSVKTKQHMLCRLTLANIMDRQTPFSYLFEALSVAIDEEENCCAMAIAWFITRTFFLANKVVLLDRILDIWPAFNCKHILKSENLVIVVELKCKMNNVHVTTKYFSVDIVYLVNEDISKENTNTVKSEESNAEVLFPDNKQITGLSARDLFAKHSKLTLISKSSFQQRGIEKQCVNLFCKVKGFLPVGENEFPKIFCGLPTKVVQGSPEFMSKLRVGDMIGTDEFKKGTLGGFVKVRGDTAFLTCLHIFLNAEELAADKISLNDNKPLLVKCYPAFEKSGASSSPSFICGKIRDIAFKTDNPESTSIDAALIKVKKKIEMCSTDYVSTGNQNTINYEQIGLKSDFLNDSCIDYRQFCFSNPKRTIATVSVGAISRIPDTGNFKVDSEVSKSRKPFDVDIEPFDKSFNDVILENMKKMASSVVATIKKTFNSSIPLEKQIINIVEGESDTNFSKETKQSIANIAYDVYCKSEANGGGDAPHDIDKLLQTSTIYHTSSILSGIISDVHMQKTFLKMSFDKESFKRISRKMYGQIHITNIRFKPGDSGMCIYMFDPVQKVQGCIGMAIANHPQNGCIATPIMDILNYFNIRNESI